MVHPSNKRLTPVSGSSIDSTFFAVPASLRDIDSDRLRADVLRLQHELFRTAQRTGKCHRSFNNIIVVIPPVAAGACVLMPEVCHLIPAHQHNCAPSTSGFSSYILYPHSALLCSRHPKRTQNQDAGLSLRHGNIRHHAMIRVVACLTLLFASEAPPFIRDGEQAQPRPPRLPGS